MSVDVNGIQKNVVALLDSGTSQSLLNKNLAGENATIKSKKSVKWETKAGEFSTVCRVVLKGCKLPQFTWNRKFDGTFHLFGKQDSDRYNAIVGRDLMTNLGIDLVYSTGEIKWGNVSVPMVPMGHFSKNESRMKLFESANSLENGGQEALAQEIKESKYEPANLDKVTEAQVSMNPEQKGKFRSMLQRMKKLFLRTKGKWKGAKVSIELKKDAKLVQNKPYKVPQAHVKVFKQEIDRLVDIGLFTKVELSEWSSPTFCIPKKDGRIRIVTDYRRVNKTVKRKAHPLPNIMDTIMSLGSFKYATCIDLNMGYYAMEMDEMAKKICTIVLP